MKLYWDYANQRLLTSISTSSDLQGLEWKLRDAKPIELYLVEMVDEAYAVVTAPTGWFPKCEIKADDGRSGAPLAWAYTFAPVTDDDVTHYEDLINLNAAPLIDAVEAEEVTDQYLDLKLEFTLQNVSGNNRDSTECDVRITRDIVRPGTPAPTLAQSTPWVTEVVANGGRHFVFTNSDGQTLGVMSPAGVPYP